MSLQSLPDGWSVWSEQRDGRVVMTYRPDVFDSQAYPPPCMPTLYIAKGSRPSRPSDARTESSHWMVTLFLEPEIDLERETYDDRQTALDGAVSIATKFTQGTIDYRDAYQVPREAYLDKLDELTGDSPD